MKLLIGGSPCTHWSIAQTKNRETTAEGIGWELFRNYVIALKKYQPDYFLYENNKSMAAAIREQITAELGVEPVLINSTLVSAQNRQRLYWAGKREPDGTYSRVHIEQPEDRGILLRDILETGVCWQDKAYTLKAQYYKNGMANFVTNGGYSATALPEPVRVEALESEGPACINALKSGKSRTVDAHMGKLENCLVPRMNDPNPAKQQYDCIAEPINVTADGKAQCLRATYYKDDIRNMVGNNVDRKTCVAVRVGDMPNAEGVIRGGQAHRIYDSGGKAVTLTARPNGGCGGGRCQNRTVCSSGLPRSCECGKQPNRGMWTSDRESVWTCPCRAARQGGAEL